MKPEGSLPHSQVPATCPYPEPARSSPYSHFLKIHFNIILTSALVSHMWSLFQPKPCIRLSSVCATCPAYHILLDIITRTILGEEYRSLSSSLCSFLHSLVTSSIVGPNIFQNTLFSNTLSLRSSLSVRDQVSHLYETTGKSIVVCILIFKCEDSKLEGKRFCPE